LAGQLMKNYHYVYILVSEKHSDRHYTGHTKDLLERLKKHNQSSCVHTSKYRPWRIESAIAFRSKIKRSPLKNILRRAAEENLPANISKFPTRESPVDC
jgi:predicted GIY-YIG superfamily endonuclease